MQKQNVNEMNEMGITNSVMDFTAERDQNNYILYTPVHENLLTEKIRKYRNVKMGMQQEDDTEPWVRGIDGPLGKYILIMCKIIKNGKIDYCKGVNGIGVETSTKTLCEMEKGIRINTGKLSDQQFEEIFSQNHGIKESVKKIGKLQMDIIREKNIEAVNKI